MNYAQGYDAQVSHQSQRGQAGLGLADEIDRQEPSG